jgi:hypothetical protein
MFYCSMHEMQLSETTNVMMTGLRENVIRDVNLLSCSWRSNHYGLHSTELVKWGFSMSDNIGVNLAHRCCYFCCNRCRNSHHAYSKTWNETHKTCLIH